MMTLINSKDRKIRQYYGQVQLTRRAPAVGQHAGGGVADVRAVGILVHAARHLVRAVAAVGVGVAEQLPVDALAVAALQLAVRALRRVRLEVGVGDPRLGQPLAVARGLHLGRPVTHLPRATCHTRSCRQIMLKKHPPYLTIQIEEEAGGAADGGEGVAADEVVRDAPDHVAAVGLRAQAEVLVGGAELAELLDQRLVLLLLVGPVLAVVDGVAGLRLGCGVGQDDGSQAQCELSPHPHSV